MAPSPKYVWVDGNEEPPVKDAKALYWAKWSPDPDQPSKTKVGIVTYARLWTLSGDGELEQWAGPILPPTEVA